MKKKIICLFILLGFLKGISQDFSTKKILIPNTGADTSAQGRAEMEDVTYVSSFDGKNAHFVMQNYTLDIYEYNNNQLTTLDTSISSCSYVVDILDYNNDGFLDIIGTYGVLYNNGENHFSECIPLIANNHKGRTYQIVDFDNDGTLDCININDIYETGNFQSDLYIYLLNEDKTIKSTLLTGGEKDIPVYKPVDFNGDGLMDIVYLVDIFANNKAILATNNGDGTFTKQVISVSNPDDLLEVDDFDNDGDKDFIITGFNGGDIYLVANNDGVMMESNRVITCDHIYSFNSFDMNKDGNIDIIALVRTSWEIYDIVIFYGNGDLSFQDPIVVGSIDGFLYIGSSKYPIRKWMDVYDYDHDGDYDIFVNEIKDMRFVVFENELCNGISYDNDIKNVSCYSKCDGEIIISNLKNGNAPYSFLWNDGNTDQSRTGLCSGDYSLTISDGAGCSVTRIFTIVQPEQLNYSSTITDESGNNFNDGSITLDVQGGTPPYLFLWSNGSDSQKLSNLAPGEYSVTVTDANGCTVLDKIIVNEFTCPNLTVNSQTSNISCFGACDGSIAALSVNNAVSPLSYKWNTGATSASLSNLCAGDYSVTITDAKNCEVVQNYTLTQPDEITITVDSIRDVRLDPLGYIAITTNNNGNYIFSWKGPGNFTAKTEDLDSLNDFGCYTLTVTDTTTNCSIDSTICLEDKTATLDFEFSNINIYPNPTKGNFIIDFNNTRLNQAEITIFDLSGKQQLNLEKKKSDKILNVESEVLNSGLYIIRIKSAKFGTSFRKVILSK